MLIRLEDVPKWVEENLKFQGKDQIQITVGGPATKGGLQFQISGNEVQVALWMTTWVKSVDDLGASKGSFVDLTHRVMMNLVDGAVQEDELTKKVFMLVGQYMSHEFAETFSRRGQRMYNPHDGNRNQILFKAIEEVTSPVVYRRDEDYYLDPQRNLPFHWGELTPSPKPHDEYLLAEFKRLAETTRRAAERAKPVIGLDKKRLEKKRFREFVNQFVPRNDYRESGKKFKRAA